MAQPKNIPASQAILITAEEAADLCRLGATTWWRMHVAGKCPKPIKLGAAVRWRRVEIEEWAAAGCPAREDCA